MTRILAEDLQSVQFGSVLSTALDAVVVMRMDGTVAGWNAVAERTFGWSLADAEGKRMSEMIIPHGLREAHEKGLSHYIETGEGPVLGKHLELEALHRDGHLIPVELSITHTREFGQPVFLGFLREISERHDAARRQTLLINELNHRVKNLLGVVAGIAHQTIRSSDDLEQFGPAFMGRLQSLGQAHELLSAATWEEASLAELVAAVLSAFADGDERVAIEGDKKVRLTARRFLGMSMVLHELTTNALKYGALSEDGGTLRISWRCEGGLLRFEWRETLAEGRRHAPPERQGFGSRMIAITVRHDLHGTIETHHHPDGLQVDLTVPLKEENGA